MAPLLLTACSGNSAKSSSASSAQRGPDSGGGAAQGDGAAGSAVPPAKTGGGADSGSAANTTNVKLANRSLIVTVGLQVKTDNAAAAAQRAQIVAQNAGGYVAGESIGSGPQTMPATATPSSAPADSGGTQNPAILPDVTGSSDSTQALLVLRVPPQSVDSVLAALTGKGSVTYQSRSATDVTGQVADVASRVTSAQAAIAELRALIDKAASMNDLISLEQALSQRESDLESLEAQQKALSDQVQYATITVGYFSQGAPVAPPAVHTGFMKGLTVGWHGFLDVVRALLAALGWLVPYLVIVVVLWWPVRRLVRVVRARGARPAEAEPEQTPGASS